MNIQKVFGYFGNELQKRLNNNLETSEDTVRMYLYKFMLDDDPCLDRYLLELPYIDSTGQPNQKLGIISTGLKKPSKIGSHQELDLFYDDGNGNEYAFEIKFHRKKTSKSNTTAKAGAIFNDLNRLNIIGNSITKYFVYVTDGEMQNYLCNKKWLPSARGKTKNISLSNQGTTFDRAAWTSFQKQQNINLNIELVYNNNNNNSNYNIEIYEVK